LSYASTFFAAQNTATSTHRAPYKYPLARYLRTLDESRRRHHHLRMSTVSKSYHTKDPIITYISNVSLRLDPLQVELQQNTIEHAPMSGMLGAPEVLQFGRNLIHLTQAKRVLDIGKLTDHIRLGVLAEVKRIHSV
uniref:Ribosomal_S4 domain-containing protein n=1 Tax=Anisakis simplex TaxID=6269 RepID=A0A0M3JHW7_ANISI